MMSNYALIKDGLVQNVVVWDGEGDIFQGFEICQLADSDLVGPGYTAAKKIDGKWKFSSPVIVLTKEQELLNNLICSQYAYEQASIKITAINQIIEDKDYSVDNSEDDVAALKLSWVNYRKALRAYINDGDGSVKVPKSPQQ